MMKVRASAEGDSFSRLASNVDSENYECSSSRDCCFTIPAMAAFCKLIKALKSSRSYFLVSICRNCSSASTVKYPVESACWTTSRIRSMCFNPNRKLSERSMYCELVGQNECWCLTNRLNKIALLVATFKILIISHLISDLLIICHDEKYAKLT